MDSADPPVGQKKMPELFAKCQKEVDDYMKNMQDKQTDEEKKQDLEDQDQKNYA